MSIFEKLVEDEDLRAKLDEVHEEAVKITKDDLSAEFNDRLEQEVSGLKTKNEEIIGEKKKLSKKLEAFNGVDPTKAREALELIDKNEDVKLLKEKGIDELLEKKTSQIRSDHEAVVNDITTKLTEAEEKSKKFETLFNTKTVDDALREEAIKANVRPEAIPDILLRGRNIFSVGEDNSVEARDKDGKLSKTEDGKILNTKNWIEGLKEGSSHYWPDSRGAGADGSGGPGSMSDLDAAIHAAAESGDMEKYRKLKAKKAKTT